MPKKFSSILVHFDPPFLGPLFLPKKNIFCGSNHCKYSGFKKKRKNTWMLELSFFSPKIKLWEHKAMCLKIILFQKFLTSAGNFGPYGPPICDHYFWKNGNFHKNCHIFCIGLNQTKNLFFSESPAQCVNTL